MRKLLFIDGCMRDDSRTLAMARAFIDELTAKSGDWETETVRLKDMNLKPFLWSDVERRDELSKAEFADSMFDLAKQLKSADYVVVAAPYWDFSFPAVLKIYVEHIMVNGLTFYIDEYGYHGMCKAKEMAYITTAGGDIGDKNFGYGYMNCIASILGIKESIFLCADGLDIYGADTEKVMAEGLENAREAARDAAENL